MFLKHKSTNDMVEILDMKALVDPFIATVSGRLHVGEELQDPDLMDKLDLTFPSDEALPKCWLDPDYRIRH